MGFVDLVKENGAQFILIVHLNHLVQFELPERLYLKDFLQVLRFACFFVGVGVGVGFFFLLLNHISCKT